jgi:RNA polymerase sigma factor (sigma-70 family)
MIDMAHAELLIERTFIDHRATHVRKIATFVRDLDAAEDIVQEAFLRLARVARAGRLPEDLAGWTYRVAMNLAKSRGRHLAVARRHAASLPTPAADPGPAATAEARELHAILRETIGELTPDHRLAISLAAQGYPGSAAAVMLGRSVGASRALLCRARSDVRAGLALEGYPSA